jgi:hypothetical protein
MSGGSVIACHGSLPFVAIASADDVLLLYDLARSGWSLPRLSHANQHLVSCAQWEPLEPTRCARPHRAPLGRDQI